MLLKSQYQSVCLLFLPNAVQADEFHQRSLCRVIVSSLARECPLCYCSVLCSVRCLIFFQIFFKWSTSVQFGQNIQLHIHNSLTIKKKTVPQYKHFAALDLYCETSFSKIVRLYRCNLFVKLEKERNPFAEEIF